MKLAERVCPQQKITHTHIHTHEKERHQPWKTPFAHASVPSRVKESNRPLKVCVCVFFHRVCHNFLSQSIPLTRPLGNHPKRHLKNVGKKHITPPYERDRERRPARPGGVGGSSSLSTGRQAPQGDNSNLWARAPLGDPLLQGSARRCRDPFSSRGRAAAANGPGSFLEGLGRQVVESGAVGGVVLSPGREQRGDGVGGGEGPGGRREDGPRRKELYAEN